MTLNDAQLNYSTIEREMLAVGFKMIIFTNHDVVKHLLAKKDVETMLIYWVYFCTNLIFEFRDKKGFKNIVADHFSCLDLKFISKSLLLNEFFRDKQFMSVNDVPWFADIVYYLAICQIPEH